jgi:hypothetical protein
MSRAEADMASVGGIDATGRIFMIRRREHHALGKFIADSSGGRLGSQRGIFRGIM